MNSNNILIKRSFSKIFKWGITLFLFAGFTAGLLHYNFIKYSKNNFVQYESSSKIILSKYKRIQSPYAIVLLDISESMKKSDPEKRQVSYFMQFCDIFMKLSKEIISNETEPKIAIVLFSTISQILTFKDGDDFWYSLNEKTIPELKIILEKYICSEKEDKRIGRNTDYYEALKSINYILKEYEKLKNPSPPAVIFFTDGINDPSPIFSSSLNKEEREKIIPANYKNLLNVNIENFRFLKPNEKIFDEIYTYPILHINDTNLNAKNESLIKDLLKVILEEKFKYKDDYKYYAPFWYPNYLGEQDASYYAKNLLTIDSNSSFTHLENPDAMVDAFLEIFINWLGLEKITITEDIRNFKIPNTTKAFALNLILKISENNVFLASKNGRAKLLGKEKIWYGVFNEGGEYEIIFENKENKVKSCNIYYYPKYDLVTYEKVLYKDDDIIECYVNLLLYNLEDGSPVNINEIYSNLPQSLEGIASNKANTIKFDLKYDDKIAEEHSGYNGYFKIDSSIADLYTLTIKLSSFKKSNIIINKEEILKSIDLRKKPVVCLKIGNENYNSLEIKGIPKETQIIRKLVNKINPFKRDE